MTTATPLTGKQIADRLGIAPRTKLSSRVLHLAFAEFERWNGNPYEFNIAQVAAHGISWAIGTGRLSGQVEAAIKALTPYQTCALLADIAAECNVIGDVPAFLVKRFGA